MNIFLKEHYFEYDFNFGTDLIFKCKKCCTKVYKDIYSGELLFEKNGGWFYYNNLLTCNETIIESILM